MSLTQIQTIIDRLRANGITVREWSGWQTRSNGQTASYVGGLVHHTATPYGSAPAILINGRPDLSGPLANFAGNDDGSITVLAAGPANHAGASGGRSMGPLPVTGAFNSRVLGLEIVYPGDQPMRSAQYHAATVWARIVADVVGFGDIERVRAHAETSITGKWDPGFAPARTIDMVAFRRDAATVLTQEADMTPDEHNVLWELAYRLRSIHYNNFLPVPEAPQYGGNLQWVQDQLNLSPLLNRIESELLARTGVSKADIQAAFTAALPSLKVTGEFHS